MSNTLENNSKSPPQTSLHKTLAFTNAAVLVALEGSTNTKIEHR